MVVQEFHLDVGDGHAIRVETWGRAGGIPVLFLHGGPGSGCNPGQRVLFDPDLHLAIFVDQRGAGRSLPHRARHANTTDHLVADLERVRSHLGIAAWFVTGGSWGATLALAYAQAHPGRVRGMVLRAVFLGTRAELDAAFGPRLRCFHPALHQALIDATPDALRDDPLAAIWTRILDPDPAVHRPAAFLWSDIERAMSELRPAHVAVQPVTDDRPLPSTPFMEAHYFLNDSFMAAGQLLSGVDRLADIPAVLVQGRYDLLCPPETTAALAARWPAARIEMVEGAGHAMSDPGVAAAMAGAIRDLTRG